MPTKTKNKPDKSKQLLDLSRQLGIVLMTAAVTLGMLELPDKQNSRIILPSQPVFAWANEKQDSNVLRRSSEEETDQHYISYSISQRTPSRSGNH